MNYSIYILLFGVAIAAIYFGESFGKKAAGKKSEKKHDKHSGGGGKHH